MRSHTDSAWGGWGGGDTIGGRGGSANREPGSYIRGQCRTLIKKPWAYDPKILSRIHIRNPNKIKKLWALIRVPYMNPSILGLSAPGFLIRFLH